MRRLLLAVALLAAAGLPTSAQRLGPPEKRPRLAADADTNDALAYYNLGVARFQYDPREAAAAFYWAARINPAWGDPLYARRAAILMANPVRLRQVMTGDARALRSDEMRRLDSLQFRALMLSPFLYRKLDRQMFVAYIKREVDPTNREGAAELDYAIDRYLRDADDGMRGWLAYSDGDLPTALSAYASALSRAKDKASIHLDRARIFAMRNQVDSSTAEFNRALDEMRKSDEKDLVLFYNSKALAEYSIAVLLEGADNRAAAREAYGRALQEDLSYYPAHMRLGLLALGLKDTTTAISELALAAQLAPDEPHLRYVNGFVLAASQHYAEAAVELGKAIELEPYYALPYLMLGRVDEMLDKGKEAAAAYQQFLDHASGGDGQRDFATKRLSEIKEILSGTVSP
jgi:Tfp pilus assembly protein PilF